MPRFAWMTSFAWEDLFIFQRVFSYWKFWKFIENEFIANICCKICCKILNNVAKFWCKQKICTLCIPSGLLEKIYLFITGSKVNFVQQPTLNGRSTSLQTGKRRKVPSSLPELESMWRVGNKSNFDFSPYGYKESKINWSAKKYLELEV